MAVYCIIAGHMTIVSPVTASSYVTMPDLILDTRDHCLSQMTCPTPLILGPLAVTGALVGAWTGQGNSRARAVHKVALARILLAMVQGKGSEGAAPTSHWYKSHNQKNCFNG